LEHLDCAYNLWSAGEVYGYLLPDGPQIALKEQVLDQHPDADKLRRFAEWLAVPGYLTIELGWQIADKIYSAQIAQIWQREDERRRVSFEVEDSIFLPGSRTEFTPNAHDSFESFKRVVVEVIEHIEPTIGAIDCFCQAKTDPFATRKCTHLRGFARTLTTENRPI
jgi:hypothetical protein